MEFSAVHRSNKRYSEVYDAIESNLYYIMDLLVQTSTYFMDSIPRFYSILRRVCYGLSTCAQADFALLQTEVALAVRTLVSSCITCIESY